jgi:hypothetical protein
MSRGSFVDGAVAGLAGFGDGLVLRHMRCHVDGAKIGHMIGRVVRLVLADRDAAAGSFASGLQHDLRSAAFGGTIVPLACVTIEVAVADDRDPDEIIPFYRYDDLPKYGLSAARLAVSREQLVDDLG